MFFCLLLTWNIFIICFLSNSYLLIFSNRNTRKSCEIRSQLTIKTSDWQQWRCSDVLNVNSEHISQGKCLLVFHVISQQNNRKPTFQYYAVLYEKPLAWWCKWYQMLKRTWLFLFWYQIYTWSSQGNGRNQCETAE